MLGISHSGMKSRVQRGRALLRKSLEDCCTIALDARGRIVGWEPRRDGRLPAVCGAACFGEQVTAVTAGTAVTAVAAATERAR